MNQSDAVQIIQYSMTPGVMISSSALFLLGLQNRASNTFIRFRALNQERRNLESSASAGEKEKARLASVTLQLDRLFRRAQYIKNAILCFYGAILCFVGTSLSLFLVRYTSFFFAKLGLAAFFLGMLLILTAALLLIAEVTQAFHILKVERHS